MAVIRSKFQGYLRDSALVQDTYSRFRLCCYRCVSISLAL